MMRYYLIVGSAVRPETKETKMQAFSLPQKLIVVSNEFGELEAYEHDESDPLQSNDPIITVNYADGAFTCSTGEEWVASIKRQAIAAHRRSETSITVA
jgi:hypothetical protein